MPDRRLGLASLLGPLAALVLLAALPSTAFGASGGSHPQGRITIADVPPIAGEDCVDDPDAQPGVGLRECPKGFQIASVLPFVGAGVVALLAIAVGWFLVMRRRASRPFLPDEALGVAGAGGVGTGVAAAGVAGGSPGRRAGASVVAGWWTCKNCGSTNMTDSARCYKCGSWPR